MILAKQSSFARVQVIWGQKRGQPQTAERQNAPLTQYSRQLAGLCEDRKNTWMGTPIDLPPYDSGSQPTLASAPFSEEDIQKIRKWQSSSHGDPGREEAAKHLACCGATMEVDKDGLLCCKCGNQQNWVPGVVLEIDLTNPL